MNKLSIIVLLACIAVSAFGQDPCSANDDCTSCAAQAGCGWCAPVQECMTGTLAGPGNNRTCMGSAWEFQKCVPCNQFTDCRSCNAREADCFWCSQSNNGMGGCQNVGFVGCPYDRTCPCGDYGSCSQCINDASCQWCGTSLLCVSNNSTLNCNATEPSYNFTTSCPCNGNGDCPSCRATDGCTWCSLGVCSGENDCGTSGTPIKSCAVFCSTNGNGSCDDCTSNPGCAWCPDTKTCVDAASHPCDYTFTCPTCEAASYCDTCQILDGCHWCEDTKECSPYGTNCLVAMTCEAYCETTYTDCQSCNQASGCAWCDDLGKCGSLETAQCFFTHTCQPGPLPVTSPSNKHCGFNGGSFVGGMFLVIGIIVLLVVVWYVYRWRTGRKFDYRELK